MSNDTNINVVLHQVLLSVPTKEEARGITSMHGPSHEERSIFLQVPAVASSMHPRDLEDPFFLEINITNHHHQRFEDVFFSTHLPKVQCTTGRNKFSFLGRDSMFIKAVFLF